MATTAESAPATPQTYERSEVDAVLGSLQVSDIELMRKRQMSAYYQAQQEAMVGGASLEDSMAEANKAAERAKNEFLNDTFQHYAASENAEAVNALVSKYDIRTMSDTDWYTSDRDDKGDVTRSSGMNQLQRETKKFRHVLDPNATPFDHLPKAERDVMDEWLDELDTLRDGVATLAAKRQTRIGGKGGMDYKIAYAQYNDQVIALGRMQHEQLLVDEDLSQAEKKSAIAEYLAQEQAKLRELTMDKLENTKVRKLVNWLRSGSRAQRFGKGLLVGAGAGVLGLGLGAAAGVAGVGVAAATIVAGVGATARFARAYAVGDALGKQGMGQLEDEKVDQAATLAKKTDDEDHFESMSRYFNEQFEKDTKKEQSKRRRSVAIGIGGVALGGAAVWGIHAAAEVVANSGVADTMADNWNSWSQDAHAGSGPEVTEPGAGPEIDGGADLDTDAETDTDTTPEHDSGGPELDPHFAIENGEGGIHFFERIGLSETDWYSIHQELLDKFPNDFYDYNGDTRISRPGQLPVEVQEFVKARFGLG